MLKKLLILMLIPFILCSCQKEQKEILTFSSWGSITETRILNQIISNFEKNNPNIKINFIHVPQNYFQKIHLLFASSQAPDVIFINNMYLPLYAPFLEDLTNIIDKNIYQEECLKALSYNEQILAIPRDLSTLVFYRNKTLIPNIPHNLEEFSEIISKSKEFGVSFERDMYYIIPYILTFGEDVFHPDKSIDFYRKLEGTVAPTQADIGSSTQAQMFLNGKIGLYLSGRWMYPKIKENAKFDWDVITFPGVVQLDASGWAISKTSQHKESAKKFVKYLASKESSEYFMNTGLIVSARKDVLTNIDNKIFIDALQKSKAIPVTKDYKKVVDRMNKELFINK